MPKKKNERTCIDIELDLTVHVGTSEYHIEQVSIPNFDMVVEGIIGYEMRRPDHHGNVTEEWNMGYIYWMPEKVQQAVSKQVWLEKVRRTSPIRM